VVSTYLDEADMEREQLSDGDQAAEVADIDEPEEWLDLTAKVVELWEPRADSVAEQADLGDGVRPRLPQLDHLGGQVEPLLGLVDVGDLGGLVAAAQLFALHVGLVEIRRDHAPAGLLDGNPVVGNERLQPLFDLVDADVELVGELFVYLDRVLSQVCHECSVSACFRWETYVRWCPII
jgi:hypothetical protein